MNKQEKPDWWPQAMNENSELKIRSLPDMYTHTETELKEAVNQFLWRYLPEHATLRQSEELACAIFSKIMEMRALAAQEPQKESGSNE